MAPPGTCNCWKTRPPTAATASVTACPVGPDVQREPLSRDPSGVRLCVIGRAAPALVEDARLKHLRRPTATVPASVALPAMAP